ncbi:DUF6624 domain-containing protein [Spirosoma arcticum]
MIYSEIARELIERRKNDFTVRQRLIEEGKLFGSYNSEMEKVHHENAHALEKIIAQIGWPTRKQVGEEASQAAWLIVQHAISLPDFMRSCLSLMKNEQDTGDIDPVNIAFLSDRIAKYENRPQSYGTQFDNGVDGRLTVYRLDASPEQVNQRRSEIGLNSLQERLTELEAQVSSEQFQPPTEKERRTEQENYDAWRRKVGWIV